MCKVFIQKNIAYKEILMYIIKNKNIEFIDSNRILDKKENFSENDYIILNGEDKIENCKSKIIYWNKVIGEIYNYAFNKYIKNYDYNFLKNALVDAKNNSVTSIIVGSSYSRKGIEENLFIENTINLSLPSQDLYYSCLIAKEIIRSNKNIENVYIGTGYYSFYHDLSKSSHGELNRVYSVYNPILKNTHNCEEDRILIDDTKFCEYSEIFDSNKIDEVFMNIIYKSLESRYYNKVVNRENTKININEIKDWYLISKEDRAKYCEERAIQHNKLIKYNETYLENITILNSFVLFCNENNVRPILLLFPGSKYYNYYLNSKYEDKYAEALNEIKGIMHFLDFTKNDIYDESDFLDMDHLNLRGAEKTSNIINGINFC